MRLADLAPLTTLSIEQIRGALAAADSCSVLPVTGGRPPHDHVLAATPSGLAIVRRAGRHSQPKVVVRWERWSRVSFACEVERPAGVENEFDLVIRVGHRTFRALLSGPSGQRALRDFVVAAQRCARGAATKNMLASFVLDDADDRPTAQTERR
jgi:hypothetical protein